MNKRWILLLAALCCGCLRVRADDIEDARKAFDLYVQYGQTADKRMLDLYESDVTVINARYYGREEQDVVIPAKRYFDIMKDAIANKGVSTAKYEDIQCVAEKGRVQITFVAIEEGGEHDPTALLYGRDKSGRMKIRAVRTVYPPLNPSPVP